MCKWRLCLRIGNRRICFCIPFVIPIPIPFPKPEPDPFFHHPDFDAASVRTLQVLVTIDRLATELSADVGRDIQTSVETQLRSLTQKLGDGVELTQHTEKG